MPKINITANGVSKLLKNLKEHKATGPDNLPACFLKSYADELTPGLTLLFQSSLAQGKVPNVWKDA